MDRKTVVIKKYENRRLYDTTNSRYVNLDEVAQAIRGGADVRVIDAASGEDITRLVLTQIIVEDAKAPNSAFPLDILRQMVVASGRASQEGAMKLMRSVFDAYRSLTPSIDPLHFMSNLVNPAGRNEPEHSRPPEEANRAAGSTSDSGSEVEDLRRRLEELEAMVSKGARKRRTRKPSAKPRSSAKIKSRT